MLTSLGKFGENAGVLSICYVYVENNGTSGPFAKTALCTNAHESLYLDVYLHSANLKKVGDQQLPVQVTKVSHKSRDSLRSMSVFATMTALVTTNLLLRHCNLSLHCSYF